MRGLSNHRRVERLIDEAIEAMSLNLSGLTVLTELGSGAFIATALVAARAHADRVFAVSRNSCYGSIEEVLAYGHRWGDLLGLAPKICFSEQPARTFAPDSDIVTNLGFVRPIDRLFVEALPPHAVIALMWEPWEFRNSDIDISACRIRGIPVIGTRETDPRLNTFDYVGMLVVKLLLERNLEILGSKIVIVGSDPFGSSVSNLLNAMGAQVACLQLPETAQMSLDKRYGKSIEGVDALILVEHRQRRELVGVQTGIHPRRLAVGDTPLIHICGGVDYGALDEYGVIKWPSNPVPLGVMSITTEYLGPKPVVDLHTAGLKVAEAAVRVRLNRGTINEAIEAAEATGLGLRLENH